MISWLMTSLSFVPHRLFLGELRVVFHFFATLVWVNIFFWYSATIISVELHRSVHFVTINFLFVKNFPMLFRSFHFLLPTFYFLPSVVFFLPLPFSFLLVVFDMLRGHTVHSWPNRLSPQNQNRSDWMQGDSFLSPCKSSLRLLPNNFGFS